MSTLNLRRFASPGALKTLDLAALVALLEREGGDYLRERMDLVPDPARFDYARLALLLANPEDGFPVRLADALYHVHELADADGLEALLDAANALGRGPDIPLDAAPADVAVRLWLHDRELVERLHAERYVIRPKSFESYLGRGVLPVRRPKPTELQIQALEARLDDWFHERRRGRHSRVLVVERPDAVWFLVRHGQPMDRRGVIRDGESACSFERPEVYDVVMYSPERDELSIHARTKGERELYRVEFGRHIFNDADYFPSDGKYTLRPLLRHGEDALACHDVDGIDWVRLREVRLFYGGAHPETVIRRAKTDLFEVFNARGVDLGNLPVFQASFHVKFTGNRSPRTVTIKPPNVATYQREADEDLVSRWFELRGFLRQVRADEQAA